MLENEDLKKCRPKRRVRYRVVFCRRDKERDRHRRLAKLQKYGKKAHGKIRHHHIVADVLLLPRAHGEHAPPQAAVEMRERPEVSLCPTDALTERNA